MNKSELTDVLSKKLNLPLSTTTGLIDTILYSMTEDWPRVRTLKLEGLAALQSSITILILVEIQKQARKLKLRPRSCHFSEWVRI